LTLYLFASLVISPLVGFTSLAKNSPGSEEDAVNASVSLRDKVRLQSFKRRMRASWDGDRHFGRTVLVGGDVFVDAAEVWAACLAFPIWACSQNIV
jgi:hypothetical protein